MLDEQIRTEMEERWARGEETTTGPGVRSRNVGPVTVTVEVAVRLSAKDYDRLTALSRAAGLSRAELARQWLEERIRDEEARQGKNAGSCPRCAQPPRVQRCDRATERQRIREAMQPPHAGAADRGWTRADLHARETRD